MSDDMVLRLLRAGDFIGRVTGKENAKWVFEAAAEIERLRESEAGERYEAEMYQALYETWKQRAEALQSQLECARRDAIEECARIADGWNMNMVAEDIATKIRALIDEKGNSK